MGIVVDPVLARTSGCTCYKIGEEETPENLMCFSQGIIGTLSDQQDRKFCERKTTKGPTKEFSKHIKKFEQMGKIMDVCAEKKEEDFPECVKREAEKLG